MYSTFEIRFMVAASKANRDGFAPIQVSLIVNGERTYIQLPRKVKPSDFDVKKQKCKDSDTNEYMNVAKARLLQIQTQLTAMGQPVSANKIKSIYKGESIANSKEVVSSKRKCGVISSICTEALTKPCIK